MDLQRFEWQIYEVQRMFDGAVDQLDVIFTVMFLNSIDSEFKKISMFILGSSILYSFNTLVRKAHKCLRLMSPPNKSVTLYHYQFCVQEKHLSVVKGIVRQLSAIVVS